MNPRSIKRFTIFSLFLLVDFTAAAQAVPDSVGRKIDSLFKDYGVSTPGTAVAVIRNDSVVFAKGYGMANLEYGIPIDRETVFHMASISKQFTAYSILVLAKQGKLSLDDDIRKYLKWFPDLHEKITIHQLLNHTSGIRDQWQLLAISGTRLDDVISQDHVVKMLSKQRALNFKPGEEHSYSNSGYTMLAEIVREVSGQTLRQFTDSVIFKPLGMKNTHFHDDYNEIEKNRAYSYQTIKPMTYGNAVLSYSTAGATSLFTTINDLSKWVMNFYTHHLNDEDIIKELVVRGKLNSGKQLDYANGIVVNTHKGWRQYSHGGADAGFRTYITVLPDLKMGFLVFSNLGEENTGGRAYSIAEYFVKDSSFTPKKVTAPRDSAAAVLPNAKAYTKFVGDYVADNGFLLSLMLRNNQLHYKLEGDENFLIRDKGDTLTIATAPEIMFYPSVKGKDTLLDIYLQNETFHMVKYRKDSVTTDALLRTYVGRYYCPELETTYGIELKDHQLYLTNFKYSDVKLNRVNSNHLTNDFWWMNHLLIRRDSKKQVIGFDVNSGRIMHLRFDKVK